MTMNSPQMVFQSHSVATTMREVPGEADAASHRLLVRAGFIRQHAAGVYSFLPLALRVLRRIERIIRHEMEQIGAEELLLPVLQPTSLWQQSGRDEQYGPELMQITDRHRRSFVLGPTHEEIVTVLVDQLIDSYRRLPITVFQLQTKFRDERRPRSGLLRGREFLMKDAYSFAASTEQLNETYQAMKAAYTRIFDRCGLQFVCVIAEAGQMGGTGKTHEFLALSDIGEDEIVHCSSCGYAAHPHLITEHSTEDVADNPCTHCASGTLRIVKAIEIGHIFKLGDTYSHLMNAGYLNEKGVHQPFEMGCYGIGLSRLLAVLAEQYHDADGLRWPQAVAPYDAHILVLTDSPDTAELIREIADALRTQGAAVLIDDRPIRPGTKFKDAELIGIPHRLTIGQHTTRQRIEWTARAHLHDPQFLSLPEVIAQICQSKTSV